MLTEIKIIDVEYKIDVGNVHIRTDSIVGVRRGVLYISPSKETSGECYFIITTGGEFCVSKDTYEEFLNRIL